MVVVACITRQFLFVYGFSIEMDGFMTLEGKKKNKNSPRFIKKSCPEGSIRRFVLLGALSLRGYIESEREACKQQQKEEQDQTLLLPMSVRKKEEVKRENCW